MSGTFVMYLIEIWYENWLTIEDTVIEIKGLSSWVSACRFSALWPFWWPGPFVMYLIEICYENWLTIEDTVMEIKGLSSWVSACRFSALWPFWWPSMPIWVEKGMVQQDKHRPSFINGRRGNRMCVFHGGSELGRGGEGWIYILWDLGEDIVWPEWVFVCLTNG